MDKTDSKSSTENQVVNLKQLLENFKNTKFISQPFDSSKLLPVDQTFLETLICVLKKLTAEGLDCCIAGGYAAWLLGKTTTYGDVDIFAEAPLLLENNINDICKRIRAALDGRANAPIHYYYLPASISVYSGIVIPGLNETRNYVVDYTASFEIENKTIEITFVILTKKQCNLEHFGYYIIDTSDLVLCKNVLYLENKSLYAIDYKLDKWKEDEFCSSYRTNKYLARRKDDKYNPNSLKLLAYYVAHKYLLE